MSKIRSVLVPALLATALLTLLAACGGTPEAAPAAGDKKEPAADAPVEGKEKEAADSDAYQKLLATCMKKAGFEYIPELGNQFGPGVAVDAAMGADYELAKKYRQKYGFASGTASIVYPNDADLKPPGQLARLNLKNRQALTTAQQDAYMIARSGKDYKTSTGKPKGCEGEARTKIYGAEADIDAKEKARMETDKANALKLNGDPELVKLAQSYAACLTKEGLPAPNTQPTSINDGVRLESLTTAVDVAVVGANTSVDNAKKLLTKEIEVSLKDLECGKEFRAAYFPKFKKNPTYNGGGGVG